MTYPQQPYGGFGGYGPPPPPPQKKNTAAIVAVVAAVVVLLAGLGITGFVAPGFFLSGDDTKTGGGTTTSTPTTTSSEEKKPDADGAEDALNAVADGLDDQDTSALRDVACQDAEPIVDEAIGDVDAVTKAELRDVEEVSDDEFMGIVEVTADDDSADFEITVVLADDEWCWQDIRQAGGGPTASSEPAEPTEGPGGGEPTASGKPVPAGALTAMQGFLDAINAGDAAAAKGTLCKDAISTPADVDELVGYEPNLEIDPSMDGIATGGQSVQLYLKGTAKGQDLEGYSTNLWVTNYDGGWCVHAFRAVVI